MNIAKHILLSQAILGLTSAGKCPFGFDDNEVATTSGSGSGSGQIFEIEEEEEEQPLLFEPTANQQQEVQPTHRLLQTAVYPAQILTCSKANKTLQTNNTTFTVDDYEDIASDVMDQYEAAPEPTRYAACLIRLAGHDFMDYRNVNGTESGGSDGCIDLSDDDNRGLEQCLRDSTIQTVYEKTCDTVSLADFIVIAAEAVTARTTTGYNSTEEFNNGTLEAVFRDHFRPGRATNEQCADTTGRMPDAEKGCTDLKSVFIDHIYAGVRGKDRFKWKLTAAISGAHTIGQATKANSGFEGKWSDDESQDVFNNDYYKSIIAKGWAPKEVDATHHQWERIDKATDADSQMMLSSDMCLAYLHNSEHDECVDARVAEGKSLQRANGLCKGLQKKGEFLNAATHHCCTWTNSRALFNTGVLIRGETSDYCGVNVTDPVSFSDGRDHCCMDENVRNTSTGDCDSSKWPKGPAFGAILGFAQKEKTWLDMYARAWWIATQNGHNDLGPAANPSKRRGRDGKKKRKGGGMKKRGQKKGGSKSKKSGGMKKSKGKKGRKGRK